MASGTITNNVDYDTFSNSFSKLTVSGGHTYQVEMNGLTILFLMRLPNIYAARMYEYWNGNFKSLLAEENIGDLTISKSGNSSIISIVPTATSGSVPILVFNGKITQVS